MTPPAPLVSAFENLPEDPRFELVEGLVDRGAGVWSFHFRGRLSVEATVHMPEWSNWHVVLSPDGSAWHIAIFPDAQAGIDSQFPHQALNTVLGAEAVWRSGAPCLERPVSAFRRDGWSGEPSGLHDRLCWYIGRLYSWIDAAAQDRLMEEGDPVELPVSPKLIAGTSIGFWEDKAGHEWWAQAGRSWGFASLGRIVGTRGVDAITDFMDAKRVSLRRPAWGAGIPAPDGRVDAVWMVMPILVVSRPWRFPATWEELAAYSAEVSVDLPGIMVEAGAVLRSP